VTNAKQYLNCERRDEMLNKKIQTTADAREFIQFLISKGLMFHLDDDVDNIIWGKDVDQDTIDLITIRHQELWSIGNPWEYAEEVIDQYLKDEE
jgi:hypothetical protein